MCDCFRLETGLNKFYYSSARMGISCIKFVLEEVFKSKFSKLTADSISYIV